MPTKTKETKKEWIIPEEHQAEIKGMADKVDETKIATKCAKSRMEKAEKDGDAEVALREFREGKILQKEYHTAAKALWDRIHEVLPETDPDESYDFDAEDMKVSVDEDDENPLARLMRG
jgi:hypothetical protein